MKKLSRLLLAFSISAAFTLPYAAHAGLFDFVEKSPLKKIDKVIPLSKQRHDMFKKLPMGKPPIDKLPMADKMPVKGLL